TAALLNRHIADLAGLKGLEDDQARRFLAPQRRRDLIRCATRFPWLPRIRKRQVPRTPAYQVTITEAAHAAGFADSAHLTRVFRATFDIPPSRLFTDSRAVQVIARAWCYGRNRAAGIIAEERKSHAYRDGWPTDANRLLCRRASRMIARGEVSAVEAVEAHIEQIE